MATVRDAQKRLKELYALPIPPNFPERFEALKADIPWAVFFWNYEYRHDLRDAKLSEKKKVYEAWSKAGLDLLGVSNKHMGIIKKHVKGGR